ncbi:uncharacterized protein METZ01_LOCUS298884, partial [marine metagenome]
GRQGAHELPRRQPRPRGLRRPRHRDPRPATQPPHRLRSRHPPLRRVEPGTHGDGGLAQDLVLPHPRVHAGRPRRGHLGRRPGPRPEDPADRDRL